MKKKLLTIFTALVMVVTGVILPVTHGAQQVFGAAEDPYAVKNLDGKVPTEQQNYMTDSQYKKLLGIDINSKTVDAFDPDDTYNPLDGYQPSVLSELFLGYMNRTDNYDGEFAVMENASSDSGFNIDKMWNVNYGGVNTYYGENQNSDMYTHAISTIALTPGNLTDEDAATREQILIENRIYLEEEGVFYEDDTRHMLSTYTRSADGTKWVRKECKDDYIADGHWAWHIDVAEQQSYTAMAVGDYDGDNYNEVAVYVPSSNANEEMAYVDIYQPVKNGDVYDLELEYYFHIHDMGSRFDVWMDKYHSYVHLNTTKIAGRDDLAVCVTQPFLTEKEFAENGALAIWSFQGGKSKLEFNDDLEYGGYRFKMPATANADLNGDGRDELVVGGFKNTGYDLGGSQRGSISDSENLVNVLLYENGKYQLAWDKPQATGAIDLDHSREMDAPAAMAGGKYRSGAVTDTVFLEGTYLDFVTGAGSTVNDQIRNGYFKHDPGENIKNDYLKNATINMGASGSFVSDKTAMEQVVFFAIYDVGDGIVDVDIVWGHPGGSGVKTETVKYNYMDANEEDDGSILTMCPINVDQDSALMRYAGKSVGWSNPSVYAVLMSMPYWQELDYGDVWNDRGETDFGVTKSKEDGTEVTVGLDVEKSLTISGEATTMGNGIGLGLNFGTMSGYAYSKTDTTSLAKSITWATGGGQNAAAILVTPVVAYKYEVYFPKHKVTEEEKISGKDSDGDGMVEEYKTTIMCTDTHAPVYTQVSVDIYNDVIEEFNEMAEKSGHSEDKLPLIDLNEIYNGAVMGDPSTYAENPEYISSMEGNDYLYAGEVYAQTGKDKAVETLSIETGSSTTESNGFSLGLKGGYTGEIIGGIDFMSVVAVQGRAGLEISGQLAAGGTWASTTSTGITYAGSFANIPNEAEGYGYEYSAGLVKWNASLKGHDGDLAVEGTGETLADKTVIIAPVVKMDPQVPPALPLDLHVLGVTENKAVLEWTNPESSRAADYYKIYYSKEADGQYYPLDGKVSGDKTRYVVTGLSPDTTYYFRIESYDQTTSLRSVMGPAVSITTKTGSEPVITTHPKDCYAKVGEKAAFTIEAEPQTEGNSISYQWQQLIEEDYGTSWVDINVASDPSIGKEATFNAAYTCEGGLISETDVDDLDGKIYRCIVTEHAAGQLDYTETISNSAMLYVGESLLTETDLSISVSDGTQMSRTELHVNAGSDFTAAAVLKESGGVPISGETVNFALIDVNQDNKCVKYVQGTADSDGTATVTFENVAAGEYELIAVTEKGDKYRGAISNSIAVTVVEVYEIIYELNGGINHNLNPVKYALGSKYILLRDAAREGYEFTGWHLDAELTEKIAGKWLDVSQMNGTLTLYAGWKAVEDESGSGGSGDSGKDDGKDEPAKDDQNSEQNGNGSTDKPASGNGIQTGDDTNITSVMIVMLGALAAVIGALTIRRKNKR